MRLSILCLLFILICSPLFAATPAGPDDKTRCGVCGMFVAPYPHWVAALEMTDGQYFYFDGPKDLFIFYENLATYQPGATRDQVANLYVTEYYTARLIPATEVFFVVGSDVLGPMGRELVPVAGREAAATFMRDHSGTKLMRFDGRELLDAQEQP
ncbi:MAG: nitrous oxide reductase accessory protein NosL [Desulfuromonadales bacterium]|nr:nitrous oxide reductase accessory protein NosL [Desulfuromonadales bacterium]